MNVLIPLPFSRSIHLLCLIALLALCACSASGLKPGALPVQSGAGADTDRYGDPLPKEALSRLGTSRLITQAPVSDLKLSPRGDKLTVADTISVTTWDLKTGKPVSTVQGFPLNGTIDVSQNEEFIAAAVAEAIYLFRAEDGELVRALVGARMDTISPSFAPDNRSVAAGSKDRMVRIWNSSTGKLLFTLDGHARPISSVVWDPQDRYVASASEDGVVRLWDPFDGTPISGVLKPAGDAEIETMSVSQNGDLLLLNLGKKGLMIFDTKTRKVTQRFRIGSKYEIFNAEFSPSGKEIVAGTGQGLLVLNAQTGATMRTVDHMGPISVARDTPVTALGQGTILHAWVDLGQGKLLQANQHSQPIAHVDLLAGSKRALTTDIRGKSILWQARRGEVLREFDAVHTAATPNGKFIATADTRGTIKILKADDGKPFKTLARNLGEIHKMTFAPNSEVLLAITKKKGLMVWNVTNGRALQTLSDTSIGSDALSIASDSRTVASAMRNTISVHDIISGKRLHTFQDAHITPIQHLALNGKTQTLISTDTEGKVAKIWDLKTGKQSKSIPLSRTCVALTANASDGRVAFGFEGGMVEIWDTQPMRRVARFMPHSDTVRSLDFSQNGKLLLTGSDDATSYVWKIVLLQPLRMVPVNNAPDALPPGAIGAIGSRDMRHNTPITAAAWSPDRRLVASSAEDLSAWVWDAKTGKSVSALKGHASPLRAFAFSKDGTIVAGAGDSGSVFVWNTRDGSLVKTIKGFPNTILSLDIAPDGKYIAVAGTHMELYEFDLTTDAPNILRGHSAPINSVRYSPDGKRIATASDDDNAIVWLRSKNKAWLTFKGHKGGALSVAFSPDGKTLYTGAADNIIRSFNILTNKRGPTISSYFPIQRIAASSQSIAAAGPGYVGVWNRRTRAETQTFSTPNTPSITLGFSKNSDLLLSASRDLSLRFWNLSKNDEHILSPGHQLPVTALDVSPDGKYLATASQDRSVILWDRTTRKPLKILRGHASGLTAVLFSPDSKTLLSASEDAQVVSWSVPDGKRTGTFSGHTKPIRDLVFSSDGQSLITGSDDGNVKLWNAPTSTALTNFRGQGQPITSVALTRDGKTLIYASQDGTIRTWSTSSFEPLFALGEYPYPITHLKLSPDGNLLASANTRGQVRIWDLKRRTIITPIETQPAQDIAFSPDNTTIAIADRESIILWDVRTGRTIVAFPSMPSPPTSVAFSPDGKLLYSGHEDATVTTWKATP